MPTGVLGLEAVRWETVTAEGRAWLDGSARGRLQLHKGPWRLIRPREMAPDLSGLDLDGGDILAVGMERRSLFRRRIALIRPGKSRLPLGRSWQRLTGVRHASVAQFGRLVRDLHDRGLDCHCWSAAFSLRDRQARFSLRDSRQLVVAAGPLGKQARLASLARLYAEFWGQVPVAQRCRFLRAYGGREALRREDLAGMGRSALRLLRRQWRRRAQASLGDNPDFFRLRRGAFRIHGRNTTAAWAALGRLLPDPDASWANARLYKQGSRSHAGSLVLAEQTDFLKRFNDRGWWYRFRHLGRESRAVRTWRTSWHCLDQGTPVPQPLLCLEERRYGLLRRSYLLTAYVGHEVRLQELWPSLAKNEKRRLLATLGAQLGKIHAVGWVHGDLKWDNLLLPAVGERPIIIDWDGSFRPPAALRRWQTKKDLQRFLVDLERFGGSAAEKAFFLSWWRRWNAIH